VTPGFVKINAGSFWMGSPSNCPGPSGYPGDCTSELGRDSDETLHYVKLTGDFEMQIHEVTQGEWKAAFGGWNPAGSTNGDSYPIETVSWFDACAYANYRSEQAALTPCYVFSEVKCEGGVEVGSNYKECLNGTQKGIDGGSVTLAGGAAKPYACEGYRLLTEAEWEYAARAGSTTALYPSAGNNGSLTVAGNVCTPLDPNLDKIGWHCGNTSATEAVGGKAANNWGLKDMSGNIWEWCSDWTNHPMTYGNGTSGAADEDPHGESGSSRVFRGGSWIDYAGSCRSANRYGNPPGNRDLNLGFRVARSL
jgi:formylglycine-generating enzyme required for sulfatase activity